MEIESGLAGMRPKDGLDGQSSDKSEFDYAIGHGETNSGKARKRPGQGSRRIDDHLSPSGALIRAQLGSMLGVRR